MSSFHRIAIIGNAGWDAIPITKAFINAGVPVRLLNRVCGIADVSNFNRKNNTTAQFDYNDKASIIKVSVAILPLAIFLAATWRR
ncbi:hypothetical protein BDK51DRAFT_43633 [Blyttiomyces helicus]|uniref:NmrA-like domain-containing protein n=1 Tax=Blyttiomyces helicus TaxID=388810 RepID=A0A4P9WNR8_9FUNG|nr:hypothetical protein BDK51DRAFT_43633 [Blyttiomyces helicus]|eukprot:RKO94779.1 hypothetical protein BDK51DRAFT_43633 [Blyttiomyces helicus]